MKKRCEVCGIFIDENNYETINLSENINKCERCKNSLNNSLKNPGPIRALFYIIEGFILLIKTPKLLKFSFIPLIITFFVLILAIISTNYLFISNFGSFLPSNETGNWMVETSRSILGIFGSFLITIIMAFMFLPVSSLICIPFNDILASEVEKNLLGERETSDNDKINIIYEIKLGLKEAIKLILLKLVILIISIPLIFIPVAGWMLFIFILVLITAIDFPDVVMARKQYTLKEKILFIRENFLSFIAFSIPILLVFWIPLLQIFLIPSSVIGATKFFIESKKKTKPDS